MDKCKVKTVIILSALSLTVAFAVTYSITRPKVASIDVPAVLDLGTHESGHHVRTSVPIYNRGKADLYIVNLGTSCGCMTVEIQTESGLQPFVDRVIFPGEKLDLLVTLRARGHPQTLLRELLTLSTNDPTSEITNIEFKMEIEGAIVIVPSELTLDKLLAGEEKELTFQIFNRGRKRGLKLKSVRTSHPDIVTVKKVIARSSAPSIRVATADEGYEVRLSVHAPSHPQRFVGYLEVIEDNEVNTVVAKVPLKLSVVRPFQINPSVLLLPRQSEMGAVYFAKAICSSTKAIPFTLVTTDVPPGMKIHLIRQRGGIAYLLHVESTLHPQPTEGIHTISLMITGKGLSERLSLPVRFWNGK